MWALKDLGYESIIINNNPETVSTDFDTSDKLYFEPLHTDDVMNVIKQERPEGSSFSSADRPLSIWRQSWQPEASKILGTQNKYIDLAEDRGKIL